MHIQRIMALGLGLLASCGAKTGLPIDEATGRVGAGGETAGVKPAGCVVTSLEQQEQAPLDLFLLLDSSNSMAEVTENDTEKWAEVLAAFEQFIKDKRSDGMRVNLTFFPNNGKASEFCLSETECEGAPCLPFRRCRENIAIPCDDTGDCAAAGYPGSACVLLGTCKQSNQTCIIDDPDAGCIDEAGTDQGPCLPLGACGDETTCDAKLYQKTAASGLLPEKSSLILSTMFGHSIAGGTPMLPALTGVLAQAKASVKTGGKQVPVVVLATDGEPSVCSLASTIEGSIDEVVQAARLGKEADVPTFAVGVFAPEEQDKAQGFLDKIAKQGGTEQAFVVASNSQLSSQLLGVLEKIRKQGGQCNYAIPEAPSSPAEGQISVGLSSPGGEATLSRVKEQACRDDGYFLDSDKTQGAQPRRVVLCPEACKRFTDTPSATLLISVNCAP